MSKFSKLGRPEQPFRTGLYFTRDVIFLLGARNHRSGRAYILPQMLFFVSPRFLRAPSTDRPETLPHGRNLTEFYKLTSKIRGVLPQKNWGAKNMQNFGQFWTTSDFDREYLRNG